jgi:tetratricopeptide (TPR) repeat protein
MLRVLLLLFGTGLSWQAAAYDPSWPGPKDFPFLPPWCKARVTGQPQSEVDMWQARMGKAWNHSHHYCAGLNFLRRAGMPQKEKSDRPNLLQQAINEFDYMITHAEPMGSPLMPEVYVSRGKAQAGLNKTGEAVRNFMRAIEMRPDWPGGYVALADFYAERGMKVEARTALNEGLERSTGAEPVLRSRLAALDAKR